MKKIVQEGQESQHTSLAAGHAQDRRTSTTAPYGDRRGAPFRNRRRDDFTRRVAENVSSSQELGEMLYASLDRPYVPNEAVTNDEGNDGGLVGALSRMFEKLRSGGH